MKIMLKTEMRNPNTMHIDKMSTAEMMQVMSIENFNAAKAVEQALPQIEKAVDAATERFAAGGRIFYIGCGTSGRLGVLDASEAPPTYGVPADRVVGIIGGGDKCLRSASENVEDLGDKGVEDLKAHGLASADVLVGISVAGNADYILKALEYAKSIGCVTIALCCNEGCLIDKAADISIVTDTGAEVLTGSTRLKAGTAQKIVLNALTTCAMTKVGNVYENMMVNLRPTNIKLKNRVVRITAAIIDCDEETATKYLEENEWNIKKAAAAAKIGE